MTFNWINKFKIMVILVMIFTSFFIYAKRPTITIEAEDMTLSGGYRIEDLAYIKDVINIGIYPFFPKAEPGFAKYVFTKREGIYDIKIHYYDENDGKCTYNFYLNDKEIASWIADKDLGDKHPVIDTRQVKEINGIELRNNDTLTLEGIADVFDSHFADLARVDRIELYFVKPLPKK